MSKENKTLTCSFCEEADRGRIPVELCTPDFTAHFPGPPSVNLEGLNQFEAMIRSAFSNIEHQIDDMVGQATKLLSV